MRQRRQQGQRAKKAGTTAGLSPRAASAPPGPDALVGAAPETGANLPLGATSGARHWAPLARLIAQEARIGAWAERRWHTRILYELTRFGIKQGWASLFGGLLLACLIGTHLFYPRGAPLARYDV